MTFFGQNTTEIQYKSSILKHVSTALFIAAVFREESAIWLHFTPLLDGSMTAQLGEDQTSMIAKRKPFLFKRNMKTWLSFKETLNKHLNKPQDFWNNVLLTDETKMELFGLKPYCYAWWKPNTAFDLIPTVSYGSGRVMIRDALLWGAVHLAVIELNMDLSVYQSILEVNVR